MSHLTASDAGRSGSRYYWAAQTAFWSLNGVAYIGQTLVYMAAESGLFTVAILVCLFLLAGSHGIRAFLKKNRDRTPGIRRLLHLLWLIPLVALAAQSAVYLSLTVLDAAFPALTVGIIDYTLPRFLSYVANSTATLAIWTSFYLAAVYLRDSHIMEAAYWRSEARLKEAELQFLRGQINSHFIFNAMNNLRALIRENPDLARERLTQLASLLRAVLQANNSDLIPLSEELKLVRSYIDLEQLQYEKRLQVSIEVDETLNERLVPPMLIQTLVENAVRHGIARTPEGGCIEIRVQREGDQLLVAITNPAPGLGTGTSGHGIGLSNTRKRLHNIFGEKATLDLRQLQEKIIAELTLPAQ